MTSTTNPTFTRRRLEKAVADYRHALGVERAMNAQLRAANTDLVCALTDCMAGLDELEKSGVNIEQAAPALYTALTALLQGGRKGATQATN